MTNRTTLKQANRAIAKAGIPLELERGEGYHYFIYDVPALNIYETVSIYVCYTNTYTAQEWAEQAARVYDQIRWRSYHGV
jgi:hypothetical protein